MSIFYRRALVTAPAVEPLTVAELRAHLRIDAALTEPEPPAPTVALAGAGAGNVDNGAHRYRVTFVTADGETAGGDISSAVTVADKTADGKVSISAIPIGGSLVTSRKLYRTAAGGATYLLLAAIADNTTTTYTDNIADSALGAEAPSTDTTADPGLSRVISAARKWAEQYTGRVFITQTWDVRMDAFPAVIELPMLAPLQSVASISYTDQNGDSQTLGASLYQVDIHSEPARIAPAHGQSWPAVSTDTFNPITVRAAAGYGDAASDVPEGIIEGIMVICADGDAQRQSFVTGTIVTRVPDLALRLLDPYVIHRAV